MINPRMIQRSAIGIVVAVLCLAAYAADSSRTEKIPAAVDSEQYAEIMASEAFDMKDLAEGAEIQRRMFNRITPPGISWLQPMVPSVVPFDAKNFDESFLNELLGEDKNSVAIYPLSLTLDPKTRETLVYNAEGKLIATIPADKTAIVWPEDADPARVTLLLDLLPSEDVEPYLYVESRISESISSAAAKSKPAKDGGFTLKSLGSSEFGLCNIQKLTNGNMRLTVSNGVNVAEVFSYTVLHTASMVVVTWTNDQTNAVTDTNTLWTPVSPPFNGLESAWECRTTNLLLTNGVGIWEDANISSNARVRFYGVANSADTDGDGLTDGAELFVYHSNHQLADSDGDGLTDSEELQLGTDLNASNVVQNVYFVDELPEAPARRSVAQTDMYVTWSNLQAKAMYTARYKEGYPEFTSTNLPASTPPMWYLTKERKYQGQCDGVIYNPYWDDGEEGIQHFVMTQSNYCRKEFSPLGWPSTPSNHACSGYSHFLRSYTSECFSATELAWDVSYSQPSTSAPVSVTSGYSVTCQPYYSTNNQTCWHQDTCDFEIVPYFDSLIGQGVPTSHTRSYNYRTNEYFIECDSYEDPTFERYEEVLTNEYTDAILWDYTDADLQMMITNWDGLAWSQKLVRINQTYPLSTNLLSASYTYALRNVSADTNRIELQALRYRWEIPTDTGVVYKIFWQEDHFPDDDWSSFPEMKEFNVLGTGSTAYSTNFDILPPGSNGVICLLPATRVALEIYQPKVLDPGETMIPEADKLSKGSVTFVNLDNDDNDALFDHGGASEDGVVERGDDELIKINLKVQSSSWASTRVRLIATAGATNIAVWTSSNKLASSAYALGTDLDLYSDFGYESNWFFKTMWVEGLSAQTAQQGTKLKMECAVGSNTCTDEVSLTVLGVEQITWKGKGNSLSDGDTLDADANWPSGLTPGSWRVFPDARVVSGSVEADPRNKVTAEVALSVAPPSEIKLYLKSFDVDDPTASTNAVDNESTADDNRGTTPAQAGQFTGESGGVLELVFPENVMTTNCEFQATMQPGDNFRVVANGDRDFLATLENSDSAQNVGGSDADKNANKQRIVCTNVTGTISEQEIRRADNYASDVLTVWRFLHVEVDSMAAPPLTGAEKNTADGYITAIAGNGTVAQQVTLSVNLKTGFTPQDNSANLTAVTGNGRFENGWIKIGSGSGTPGETQTSSLLGNGDDYVRKVAGIDVPALLSKTGQSDVSGKVIAWSGTTFTLSVSSGTLSTNYIGGSLNVAGVSATVSAVSTNGGVNTVTVTAAPTIPFSLYDDDTAAHPYEPNITLMQSSDAVTQNLFAVAFVRPNYDLGPGTNIAPFMRNVEGGASFGVQIDAGRDATSIPRFWTVYIQGTFQGENLFDKDPNIESSGFGRSFLSARGGAVFVETIGEFELSQSLSPGTVQRKTMVHEVGHQFALTDNTGGIMNQGWPVSLYFAPDHINVMREIISP